MSLCLEGSTYSAALPVPPKDPMDLSGEEDALQSLELTPNSRMWPGLTTSLIKVFKPKYLGSSLTDKQHPLLEAGCQDRCSWSLTSLATLLWGQPFSIARQGQNQRILGLFLAGSQQEWSYKGNNSGLASLDNEMGRQASSPLGIRAKSLSASC